MKITNPKPKGKWIHVKKNGYTEKVWLAGYSSIELSYVEKRTDLNLNAYEEAIVKAEENTGVEVDSKTDIFQYKITMTEATSTGGTTSLSATTLYIDEGMNTSFYIYTTSDDYLSAYTVNNISYIGNISDPSATTITATISNIKEDKDVYVAFARNGS